METSKTNDLTIIEHIDYTAPVDSENVFYIQVPSPGKNPNKNVKAFRVFGNVFVVPQRYLYGDYYTKDLSQPEKARVGNLYDPLYLSNDKAKSIYLKKINLLLKRINTSSTGKSLLRALYNGLPLKDFKRNYYDRKGFNSCSTVVEVDEHGNKTNKKIPCSLIIYGPPANCVEAICLLATDKNNTKLTTNTHGTMAEIIFNPELFQIFMNPNRATKRNSSHIGTIIQDPVIYLFYLLVEAKQINYGSVMGGKLLVSNKAKTLILDRLSVFKGLLEGMMVPSMLIYNNYDRQIIENMKVIIDTLNGSGAIPADIKKIYQEKYFLNYDKKIKRYNTSSENCKKLISLIRYSINVVDLSKELNILIGESYYDRYSPTVYRADILNKYVYTIEKGFNLKGSYMGQYTSNSKLIKDDRTVTSKLHLCSGKRRKRGIGTNLCIDLEYEKWIPYVNYDYSDYQLKHTVDGEKLLNEEPITKLQYSNINYKIQSPLTEDNVEDIEVESKTLRGQYLPTIKEIVISKASRYHVLKAQEYDKGLDPKINKITFIDADGLDQTIMDAVKDNKKFYGYFPKTHKTINTATSFAYFYFYTKWVRQVVQDFKEESGLKRIEKVGEEIIQIVPFIGAAYNVGKDIASGEFVQAFKDVGIALLLLVVPEFVIPLASYDILTNISQTKNPEEIRDKIYNTLENAIEMRESYIRSYINDILSMWWGHYYLQVEDMLYNLGQQLENYKYSILHNIQYHGLKVSGSNPDKIEIVRDNVQIEIDFYIEETIQNTVNMLSVSAKKQLKEHWAKNNIIAKLKEYDISVASKLNHFIDENAVGIIDKDIIQKWKNQVAEHFNGAGLDNILEDRDIDNYIDNILYDMTSKQSEKTKTKILCHLETTHFQEHEEIIDLTGQTEITLDGNSNTLEILQGRSGYCMLFRKGLTINLIKNPLLSKRSLYGDFTWSFWIRHPLLVDELDKDISIEIIRLINEKDRGFKFVLKNGRIDFIIVAPDKGDSGNLSYIFTGDYIEDNRWHLITVTYNSERELIDFYVDDRVVGGGTTEHILKEIPNTDLKIGFSGNHYSSFFFKIEEFRIYDCFFHKSDVVFLYDQDMSNYLYDHWGEVLRFNKTYYLNHVTLEGHKTSRRKLITPKDITYLTKEYDKITFRPYSTAEERLKLYMGERIEFNFVHFKDKIRMIDKAVVRIKMLDEKDKKEHLYSDTREGYLIVSGNTSITRSDIFQLHTLRNEISRDSKKFNPYSVIITATTYKRYNTGTFIDTFWRENNYFKIDLGSFKVNRNAKVRFGKSPFIEGMESHSDVYINRFCWTFVPEDEGWKEI